MDEPLSADEASKYRVLVARLKYLAPDRPDIAFSVKALARQMAAPIAGDWLRFQRLGRYMKGRPRMQQVYEWQEAQRIIKTFSDADWAGCKGTRTSTTGVCVTIGSHTFTGWSKTQTLTALSSAESELYAALKGSAETLGIMSMMADLGYIFQAEVWGDASAALGIIHRNGLGETRHIDTSLLWIQETAATQRLKYEKVLGKDNRADPYTKYLDIDTDDHHTKTFRSHYKGGRADEAPKLHTLSKSLDECLIGETCDDCDWIGTLRKASENTTAKDWRDVNVVMRLV